MSILLSEAVDNIQSSARILKQNSQCWGCSQRQSSLEEEDQWSHSPLGEKGSMMMMTVLIKIRLMNMAILSPATKCNWGETKLLASSLPQGGVRGGQTICVEAPWFYSLVLDVMSHPVLFAAGWILLRSFPSHPVPLFLMVSMYMWCFLHIESCKHFFTLTQLFLHWRISVSAHSLYFFFLKDAKIIFFV